MNTPTQKQPPKTNPRKIIIKNVKTPQVEIDVNAQILSDTKKNSIKGGETTFESVGALSKGNFFEMPSYSWQPKGGQKIIVKINGPVKIKGTVKIQTTYNPNTKPTDRSLYGRGTTPEDEKAGNTSVGFHESCHQSDYLSYLKKKALPVFGGKTGMTVQQYEKEVAAFSKAFDRYFKEMEKNSNRLTDEVGYKKSIYKSKGPRK